MHREIIPCLLAISADMQAAEAGHPIKDRYMIAGESIRYASKQNLLAYLPGFFNNDNAFLGLSQV
jgi:hypothetical protein